MKNTQKMLLSALFSAMITVMTAYICHIPFGNSGGYFHLGDSLIYIMAASLPKPYAVTAAIIGAGLADFLTAPLWVIPTIIIKALICITISCKSAKLICTRNIISVFINIFITVGGYYLAEAIIFNSFLSPIYSIVGNLTQAILSGILFIIIGLLIDKKNLKKRIKL